MVWGLSYGLWLEFCSWNAPNCILLSKILWLTFAVWLYMARGKGLNQLLVMTVRFPELHPAASSPIPRLISVNKSHSLWQQTEGQGVHGAVQIWSGQSGAKQVELCRSGLFWWESAYFGGVCREYTMNSISCVFAELSNEIWSDLVYQKCLTCSLISDSRATGRT